MKKIMKTTHFEKHLFEQFLDKGKNRKHFSSFQVETDRNVMLKYPDIFLPNMCFKLSRNFIEMEFRVSVSSGKYILGFIKHNHHNSLPWELLYCFFLCPIIWLHFLDVLQSSEKTLSHGLLPTIRRIHPEVCIVVYNNINVFANLNTCI